MPDARHTSPGSDPIRSHPNVQRVRSALDALGVHTEITVLDGAARTAAQAADFLGIIVGQIASSLVFTAHSHDEVAPTPLLVLTSGAHRVDTTTLAASLGLASIGRADAELVRASTGFVIGGVPPVGHLAPVRTLVDVALAGYDTIWAAAGHPHTVFETTYDELVRITGGQPAEVG
ncbi:MAG TPA: YbaK/EbsC family protein [Candidatus Lustribacter sp.]|nr:YbaK/EbsC family protein [Candidatus Lustribacter sp.]